MTRRPSSGCDVWVPFPIAPRIFEARHQHRIFRCQPQAAPDVFLHLSQAWHRLGYGNKGENVKDGCRNVGFKTFLTIQRICVCPCVSKTVLYPENGYRKLGAWWYINQSWDAQLLEKEKYFQRPILWGPNTEERSLTCLWSAKKRCYQPPTTNYNDYGIWGISQVSNFGAWNSK